MIQSLKVILQLSAEDIKFDKDKWAKTLAPFLKLWNSLFASLKDEKQQVKITQQNLASSDPVDAFVYLETQQAIQVLDKINSSIFALNDVLFGNGLLTSEILQVGKDLLIGLVPARWTQLWEGPDNPSNWLKGFYKRVYALKAWVERARAGALTNAPVSLSELFHPEVFLNAFRQKVSRKLQKPLNELKLVASLDADIIKGTLSIRVRARPHPARIPPHLLIPHPAASPHSDIPPGPRWLGFHALLTSPNSSRDSSCRAAPLKTVC